MYITEIYILQAQNNEPLATYLATRGYEIWGHLRDEFRNYLLLMPPEQHDESPQKYNSDMEFYAFGPFS